MRTFLFALCAAVMLSATQVFAASPKRTLVTIQTNHGKITLWLFDETPLHRDNFLRLCQEGTLKGMLFHRVIENFLIQAGDLRRDKAGAEATPLRMGNGEEAQVAAEILPQFFCRQGALIDAKQGDDVNPLRASAGTHFCIVQGRRMTDEELDKTEERMNQWHKDYLYHRASYDLKQQNSELARPENSEELQRLARAEAQRKYDEQGPIQIPEAHRAVYRKVGGTPHLDGTVTIFGQLVSGQDVVERISKVSTNDADRPLEDVVIRSVRVRRR